MMKYYNLKRLHTANDDRSPIDYEINFENYQNKVSGWS